MKTAQIQQENKQQKEQEKKEKERSKKLSRKSGTTEMSVLAQMLTGSRQNLAGIALADRELAKRLGNTTVAALLEEEESAQEYLPQDAERMTDPYDAQDEDVFPEELP